MILLSRANTMRWISPSRALGKLTASLGPLLFPSVPLWTLVAGAMSALGRTLSLAGVPQLVIRDLPTPVWPATPPPPVRLAMPSSPPSLPLLEIEKAHRSPSAAPSLEDILLEEEHEVTSGDVVRVASALRTVLPRRVGTVSVSPPRRIPSTSTPPPR